MKIENTKHINITKKLNMAYDKKYGQMEPAKYQFNSSLTSTEQEIKEKIVDKYDIAEIQIGRSELRDVAMRQFKICHNAGMLVATLRLAQIYEQQKQLDIAEKYYVYAAVKGYSKSYEETGMFFFRKKEYGAAEKWLKKAIEERDDNNILYLRLAQTYEAMAQESNCESKDEEKSNGYLKESEKYYRKAVDNNVEKSALCLRKLYLEIMHSPDKAIEAFEEIIKTNHKSLNFGILTNLYIAKGEYKKALETTEKWEKSGFKVPPTLVKNIIDKMK